MKPIHLARFGAVALVALAVVVVVVAKRAEPDTSTDVHTVPSALPAPTGPVAETVETAAVADAQTVALPRLLDLGADKCIPCKKMAPILVALREEFDGRFEVVFIDVWKNRDVLKSYELRVIPTQIFYDERGAELFRHEGFYSRDDILGKWADLGYAFPAPGEEGTVG